LLAFRKGLGGLIGACLSVQAKTKGFHTTIDIGVKYAEKQTRRFDEGTLKAGQSVIGLQVSDRFSVAAAQGVAEAKGSCRRSTTGNAGSYPSRSLGSVPSAFAKLKTQNKIL
jgi:hypothetical protein